MPGIGEVGSVDLGQVVEGSASDGALGKEEFLSLLTTQLSNQDPLDPADSTAMVAQLAQFSALEQMQNLNVQFQTSRQADMLMRSMSLAGELVDVEFGDGTGVQGTVNKVDWQGGDSLLYIDGQAFRLSDVASIVKASQ